MAATLQTVTPCEKNATMSNNLRGCLRIGAMPSMSPGCPLFSRSEERDPGIVIDVNYWKRSHATGANEFLEMLH